MKFFYLPLIGPQGRETIFGILNDPSSQDVILKISFLSIDYKSSDRLASSLLQRIVQEELASYH